MGSQSWRSLLNEPLTYAVTSNTFTGPQDLVAGTVAPAGPVYTQQANTLVPGSIIKMVAWGTFSTTGTPTLVFGPYLGTTALAVNVALTTASGAATLPWHFEVRTIVRTAGPATIGTAMSQGFLDYGTTLTAVTRIPVPGIAAATVAIDTTTAQTLTPKATWSASSASNIVVLHGLTLEGLNC